MTAASLLTAQVIPTLCNNSTTKTLNLLTIPTNSQPLSVHTDPRPFNNCCRPRHAPHHPPWNCQSCCGDVRHRGARHRLYNTACASALWPHVKVNRLTLHNRYSLKSLAQLSQPLPPSPPFPSLSSLPLPHLTPRLFSINESPVTSVIPKLWGAKECVDNASVR